jgi:transcriptional regulator with XRE-family HTH domain
MAALKLLELYKAKAGHKSQRELARMLRVSHTALQKWENGGGMSPKVVFRIGKALDLSATEMLSALKAEGR